MMMMIPVMNWDRVREPFGLSLANTS